MQRDARRIWLEEHILYAACPARGRSGCMSEVDEEALRAQAMRYRRMAREIVDDSARKALRDLADEYEAQADALSVKDHPGQRPGLVE
jgi:hypothetical protein